MLATGAHSINDDGDEVLLNKRFVRDKLDQVTNSEDEQLYYHIIDILMRSCPFGVTMRRDADAMLTFLNKLSKVERENMISFNSYRRHLQRLIL